MRVVFDTVVFVRGLIRPSGWWGKLLFDCAASYELIVSPQILTEYLDVLRRPEITRKYRQVATRDTRAILDLLTQATVVEPTDVPSVSRDPDDDIFFATAQLGNAAYIVSEDRDQLDVKEYQGIRVVTAEAFLRILEQEDEEGDSHDADG
jgi:putative PIN family toxin of toxin-antitoxin system